MIRIRALVVGAVASFFASAASADDRASPVDAWSGSYLGAQVGYQWADGDFHDPAYNTPPATYGSYDVNGIVAGLHAGYNIPMGNSWMIGVEADAEFANGSDSSPDATNFVVGSGEINWQGSVRGRAGYRMDRSLLFATAGVAFGGFDFGYTFSGITDSFDNTLIGLTVGAGWEYAISNSLSGRIEYRFTDFGETSGSIANCCAGPPFAQDHSIESQAVRLGLSWHY